MSIDFTADEVKRLEQILEKSIINSRKEISKVDKSSPLYENIRQSIKVKKNLLEKLRLSVTV